MEAVCVKIEEMDDWYDWYVIERAEHDGREWMEPRGDDGYAFMRSARICDADVEGTGAEMLGMARALEGRHAFYAKRCAVEVERLDGETLVLWSPRNSRERAHLTQAEADRLTASIRATVQQHAGG